jgi:phage-related protein
MNITPIGTGSGSGFDLFAMVVGDDCLVQSFIDNLVEKDQKQIIALFKLILDSGLPHNKEKFRHIGEQIYELKTRGGVRVLSFFGGPNLSKSLILTHGFYKKGSRILVRERQRAIDWHDEYSKGDNSIV